MAGPKSFLETRITQQTVFFMGKGINISHLADAKQVSPSYLSLIFQGKRMPSYAYAEMLADALRMEVTDLIVELKRLRVAFRATKA